MEVLEGELFGWRYHGLLPTLYRWAFRCIFLVIVLLTLWGVFLYSNEPHRPVTDIASDVMRDAMDFANVMGGTAQKIGAATCQGMAGRMVSAASVESCALMPSGEDAQICLQGILARL